MQKLLHNQPRSQILFSCDVPPLMQGDESHGGQAPIVFSWTHCHCQHWVLMTRNTPMGKLGSAEHMRNNAGLLSFLPWENPLHQHRYVSSPSCPDTAALSPAEWEVGDWQARRRCFQGKDMKLNCQGWLLDMSFYLEIWKTKDLINTLWFQNTLLSLISITW